MTVTEHRGHTGVMKRTEQYAVVHQAIQAVASHCDGALSLDGVGFSGQDTKYGKRMAAVPFETLTDDDHREEAHIILKYKAQVETYLGINVGELEVVREAQGYGTNYTSRDNARRYEKKSKNASKADLRKADVDGANISITWVKGDPDFGALLAAVRACPGRRWTGTVWTVPASDELAAFLDLWDIPCTPAARALLDAFQAQPVEERRSVLCVLTLEGDKAHWGKVDVNQPRGWDLVNAIKALPGRWYDGKTQTNTSDLMPAVLEVAAKFDVEVPQGLADAIAAKQTVNAEVENLGALLSQLSRAKDASQVSPVLADLVAGVRVR